MSDLINSIVKPGNDIFILSILPLILTIILLFYLILKLPSYIRSKDIFSAIFQIIIIFFIISICMLYKNLVFTDEYKIGKSNIWVIIIMIAYISAQLLFCLSFLKKRSIIKILLTILYFIITAIMPIILIIF